MDKSFLKKVNFLEKIDGKLFFYICDQFIDYNNVKKLSSCCHQIYRKLTYIRNRYEIVRRIIIKYRKGRVLYLNKLMAQFYNKCTINDDLCNLKCIELDSIPDINGGTGYYLTLGIYCPSFITRIKLKQGKDIDFCINHYPTRLDFDEKSNDLLLDKGKFIFPSMIVGYSRKELRSENIFTVQIFGYFLKRFEYNRGIGVKLISNKYKLIFANGLCSLEKCLK